MATCVALSVPSAAAAASGPCDPGKRSPTCQLSYGTVTFVGDGDTISVRLDEHRKDPPRRIRLAGVQAMEEYVYTTDVAQRRGECQAGEATAELESLIRQSKQRVQLAGQSATSSSRGRPIRLVRVRVGGTWRDVGRILLDRGLVLPLAFRSEWAMNATYSALAQRAAEKRIGIWNSYYCGPGPDDFAYLRVWVNSNPPGNDDDDPNGEWVKVRNLDPSNPVPLGGWWLRDSGLRRYVLPAGATIPGGGTVTVFVGPGTDTASEFFWGQRSGVFDNVTSEGGGDGAYLFDPEGDLRAWMVYPCRYKCSDPLAGALKLTAHPKGTEYVKVANTSTSPVNLEGYQLVAGPHNYPFPAGTIVQPGETLRVDVVGDPANDQPLHKYWTTEDRAFLYDAGGSVRVSTFDFRLVACDSWGTGSCPSR
jgi:endonuclease YncB( thermonuclease family)